MSSRSLSLSASSLSTIPHEQHRHAPAPMSPEPALSNPPPTLVNPGPAPAHKQHNAYPTPWIDPTMLPASTPIRPIAGNAPPSIKQLIYNTYIGYGVGPDDDSFGARVGRAVTFVEVNVALREERGRRLEACTIAEVEVTKHMLNGAGMLHGGCLAYIVDNCCSTPLIVLGLVQNSNGVGVTQSMNVLFHAPAPAGTVLKIISTSVSLGGRVMSSRCEVIDKDSGRIIASAFLSKMQPGMAKL